VNSLQIEQRELLRRLDAGYHGEHSSEVFESLLGRERDTAPGKVPDKAEKDSGGRELCTRLPRMPRHTQRINRSNHRSSIETVKEGARRKWTGRIREAKDGKIIFVLERQCVYPGLRFPYVDQSVANLASIAASRGCTERKAVIKKKLPIIADDEIGFVSGENGTGAVKRFDVKSTSLGAIWSTSNLVNE
jgi:hypothetical protein